MKQKAHKADELGHDLRGTFSLRGPAGPDIGYDSYLHADWNEILAIVQS